MSVIKTNIAMAWKNEWKEGSCRVRQAGAGLPEIRGPVFGSHIQGHNFFWVPKNSEGGTPYIEAPISDLWASGWRLGFKVSRLSRSQGV